MKGGAIFMILKKKKKKKDTDKLCWASLSTSPTSEKLTIIKHGLGPLGHVPMSSAQSSHLLR